MKHVRVEGVLRADVVNRGVSAPALSIPASLTFQAGGRKEALRLRSIEKTTVGG